MLRSTPERGAASRKFLIAVATSCNCCSDKRNARTLQRDAQPIDDRLDAGVVQIQLSSLLLSECGEQRFENSAPRNSPALGPHATRSR